MKDTHRIKAAVYIVSAIWSIVLFAAGVQLPGAWAKVLSFVPLLIVLLFAAFDNWLWRLGPVKGLVRRPYLTGTWKGTLTSFRAGPDGQEIAYPAIPIYVVVRQTYLDLSITLLTSESKSRSIIAFVQASHSDDYTIFYHYANLPGLPVRERSPEHSGGARIEAFGLVPLSLDGEYWTNRRSRGTFEVRRASDKVFGSYQEAAAELDGSGS
ncbi:hypothetical protein AB0E12_30085 [Micromonospora chersina]|uniref:Cap15 family cyclic dinucleotide receptor domain-containing protein n=1 Tax=Micromonospora chersina TaxID=47854 RepID=UPI0033FEF296